MSGKNDVQIYASTTAIIPKSSLQKSRLPNRILINCENLAVAPILESRDFGAKKTLFGPNQVIALDEAQTLSNTILMVSYVDS